MNKDLFPETLLVSATHGHIFTDSLKIAEHFGKRHDNVVRVITDLIAQLNALNFEGIKLEQLVNFDEQLYTDSRGRQKAMYRLTRDGFALLAMGFTGQKALYWKIQFINAFNAMEAQLRAQEQRYLAALDHIRPNLRPVVEGTQQGQSRTTISEQLGKSANAVTYHRRVAKHLGLLVA